MKVVETLDGLVLEKDSHARLPDKGLQSGGDPDDDAFGR